MTEQVLVVPRTQVESFLQFQGYRAVQQALLDCLLSGWLFKPRSEMESDPSFKQIIPYIILRCQDQIFRYWRTKKGGESRLHHLYSIGVGGHINPQDENLFTSGEEIFTEAAMRELQEEVHCVPPSDLKLIGLINDDESEVGRVHLGLVYEAWFEKPEVTLREQALGRGEWKTLDNIQDDVEYETWSQFILDEYLKPITR